MLYDRSCTRSDLAVVCICCSTAAKTAVAQAEDKQWRAEAEKFERMHMSPKASPGLMGMLNSLVGAGEAVYDMGADMAADMAADAGAMGNAMMTKPPEKKKDRQRRPSLTKRLGAGLRRHGSEDLEDGAPSRH